jgi:hypothetical protein
MELTKIYGQLFLTKHGVKDNGIWLEALKDLTPKALESGLMRLNNLAGKGKFAEYPPNCLQFKALCLAFYEELNVPKASDAYREIINSAYKNKKAWSHEMVEFIAHRLPDEFFKLEQEAQAYAVFKSIYNQIFDLVKQGHAIPKSIEKQRQAHRRTPSIASAHIQQMKQHIGA